RLVGTQPTLREELAGLKILVVEDCRDNQVIYASFLRTAGAEVVIASDGHEALASVASAGFDIIFMDIQMPELDGYQATRALRSQGIRTPIVAVTAHAVKGERERCLAVGCDEYLTKPVDGDTLVRTALWFAKA